jgi:hypothetical protein
LADGYPELKTLKIISNSIMACALYNIRGRSFPPCPDPGAKTGLSLYIKYAVMFQCPTEIRNYLFGSLFAFCGGSEVLDYFVHTQTQCKNTTKFSLMEPLSGNRSRPFRVSLDTWTVLRRSLDLSGPQFIRLNPCFRILYPRISRMKTGICAKVSPQSRMRS